MPTHGQRLIVQIPVQVHMQSGCSGSKAGVNAHVLKAGVRQWTRELEEEGRARGFGFPLVGHVVTFCPCEPHLGLSTGGRVSDHVKTEAHGACSQRGIQWNTVSGVVRTAGTDCSGGTKVWVQREAASGFEVVEADSCLSGGCHAIGERRWRGVGGNFIKIIP